MCRHWWRLGWSMQRHLMKCRKMLSRPPCPSMLLRPMCSHRLDRISDTLLFVAFRFCWWRTDNEPLTGWPKGSDETPKKGKALCVGLHCDETVDVISPRPTRTDCHSAR